MNICYGFFFHLAGRGGGGGGGGGSFCFGCFLKQEKLYEKKIQRALMVEIKEDFIKCNSRSHLFESLQSSLKGLHFFLNDANDIQHRIFKLYCNCFRGLDHDHNNN